jgi:tetratricopeptide (TPR) repeat protein
MVTGEGRVKILDFGLARRVKQHLSQADNTLTISTTTQPGTVVGTAGYMSPEQICGEEIDHRSDIFSAGLVFYEMAAGARAFRGRNSIEVMSAVLKEEPQDLPGRGSRQMNRIVRRCMEKDPAKRYQSAAELSAALGASASNRGLWNYRRWVMLLAACGILAFVVYWQMGRRVPVRKETAAVSVPATVREAAAVPAEAQAAPAPVPVGAKARAPKIKASLPAKTDSAKPANDPAYQQAYEEGMLLLSQRKWAEAVDRLSDAVRLKPDSAFAYLGRCRANGLKGDDPQAVADCTEVIRRLPDSADAYHERGAAYVRTQDFEKGISDMDAALRLGDTNPAGAHSLRGRARNGLKQWDAAIQDFDEAVRLNPKVGQFYMFRGVARNGQGDFAKAIEDFDEALRLQPNLPMAYAHRAIAKARTGDKEGAAADRKQSKELRK